MITDKYPPLHMAHSPFLDANRTPELANRYTLRPILEDHRNCLACRDIAGIEDIALTELELRHQTRPSVTETYRCNDVFAGLAQLQRPVSPWAELRRACFTIRFRGGRGPCRVVIEPSGVSVDGDTGGEVIHRWLIQRGFVPSGASGAPDAVPGAVRPSVGGAVWFPKITSVPSDGP
jgi:hypothetical protein